jgi:hypothetical protein
MTMLTVHSSWGDLVVDPTTGDVNAAESHYETERPEDVVFPSLSIRNIYRFDLAEWRRTYPGRERDSVDILDLGYWTTRAPLPGFVYVAPAHEWREEFNVTALHEHRLPTRDRGKGWEYYSPLPFNEDLARIRRVCGSDCYESLEYDGHVWLRRVD